MLFGQELGGIRCHQHSAGARSPLQGFKQAVQQINSAEVIHLQHGIGVTVHTAESSGQHQGIDTATSLFNDLDPQLRLGVAFGVILPWDSGGVHTSEHFISDDPGEYNNLAQADPARVQEKAASILRWRALYPLNGTRARLSSPPGWHLPLDWATYPRPMSELQPEPVESMAPTVGALRVLDYLSGDRGRLIYDCEPLFGIGGLCKP